MSIITMRDLVAVIDEGLECAGVSVERETLLESIRTHRVERYEDHDEASLDALYRLVWDDVTDGAEYPS